MSTRIHKGIYWSSFICFTLFQFLVWYLTYFNDGNWKVNIVSYTIPLLFVGIFISIFLMLLIKKVRIAFVLIGLFLLFSFKPLTESFSIGYLFKDEPKKSEQILNVMSFNASTFNNLRNEEFMPDDSVLKSNFFDYISKPQNKPDILCIQEFHHDDADNSRIIDEIVKRTQLNYFYMAPLWQPFQNGMFGMIVMSRYPILNKGTLFVGKTSEMNRGMFVDILYKQDTIRVFNIHLESMNIRLQKEDSLGMKNKLSTIVSSLKRGSERSQKQIEHVLFAIKNTQHPILLCGDFNTFPYGYSYQEVKKLLCNSFEKSGRGFGFSLNLSPYFARIDNQFYSYEFSPLEFKVIRSIKESDHFPIVGKYLYEK